ncbi:oligosaccharide flippase family protein [Weissella sp. GP1]|uniref:lipopolysaccharide biosynthesis protein n=1 Tax=Weissella confusa TaxID=1583 RepID=UPI0032DB25EF
MQKKAGVALAYLNILAQNGVYLLYTPLLLRTLGNEQYGLFQLTSQMINTLTVLSLGFGSTYVRFYWLQKKKSQRDVNLLNGTYLIFFSFIVSITIIIGLLMARNADQLFSSSFSGADLFLAKQLMIFLTLNVAAGFLSSIFNSYIIANEQFVFQQFRQLLSIMLQPIVAILLLKIGYNVVSISVVQFVLTMILLFLSARYSISKLGMKFEFDNKQHLLIKNIFAFSGFVMINQIVDLVNNNFPGIIVGKYMTATDVAIYSVAIQIRSLFFQLSMAISNVFVPQINQLVINNKERQLTDLMISVGRLQLTVLLVVFGGFVVLGPSFISIWAGNGFQKSYWMIVVMVAFAIIPLSQNIGIEIQRAKNLHKFRSASLALLAIINVVITTVGVQMLGVFGGVIGYVFSIVVGNGLLMNLYNHKVIGLDMKRYWREVMPVILTPIIPIIFGVSVAYYLGTDSLFKFVGIGSIYILLFAIIRVKWAMTNQEKEMVNRMLTRFR